jgi:hypothetical protein
MWDWCQNLLEDVTWKDVLLGVGLFIVMFALSLAEVTFILVKLPTNYFTDEYHHFRRNHHVLWRRLLWAILKNAIGLVHIIIGGILSIPGVPGQGVLTILIGVMLMDLPGVRRMERWLVSRVKVRLSIDKIRARFKKPPLVLDGDSTEASRLETEKQEVPVGETSSRRNGG